jgi:hypothetical protein
VSVNLKEVDDNFKRMRRTESNETSEEERAHPRKVILIKRWSVSCVLVFDIKYYLGLESEQGQAEEDSKRDEPV